MIATPARSIRGMAKEQNTCTKQWVGLSLGAGYSVYVAHVATVNKTSRKKRTL